jgi:signal transduction histidine kinase
MRLVKLPPEEELVEIRTGLRRIREATISMLVVLENARAVSRLTTQEIGVVKLEEKDLSAMTSRTVAMLQPAAAGRHLKMEASIQPDVRARVLPGFESVVQNLLDNAIKYTPRGGTVGVRLFTDGSHVGIEVWDTGPGIPPEKRDKLFRKFERLGAEGGLTEGHGLGLSIVSKMVELAGGTVSVSDKGDGSPGAVFMVELPLAGSADSSLPAGSGAAPSGMARPLLR